MAIQELHGPVSSSDCRSTSDIRSVAIIAHVDHGKTTLVNALFRASGVFRDNETVVDCAMDSNPLERERGITILAKNTGVNYNGIQINIIDTPGHADFGGEVERVLSMVDSVILVVAAEDGPMPQTTFVLRKALERGLKPIVVINKIDTDKVSPQIALNAVFDLFFELKATDEQLDFPYVFASGRQGKAKLKLEDELVDMRPLLDLIVSHCPPPKGDASAALQMQVSIIDRNDFVGRLSIGCIHNGTITVGQQVVLLKEDGVSVKGKITKIFKFYGLTRVEAQQASAGEIVAIAGFDNAGIGDTIASGDCLVALPRIHVDAPTVKMAFMVNDSPLKGTEGQFVTSRHLRDRLMRELETDVSLRVEETDNTSVFMVSGRGELHLGIIIEKMRREGFEFAVSRPEVITKTTADGTVEEPFEKLSIIVDASLVGAIMEELGPRRADPTSMNLDGQASLEFVLPTRGLIGLESRLKMISKGTADVSHCFLEYRPWCGDMPSHRNHGAVTAWSKGEATGYALSKCDGVRCVFILPGTHVYGGMIVGENSRPDDLGLNVCKEKHLSNVRTKASDGIQELLPYQEMSLAACIEFIGADELIEVTPKSIRMRKRVLPNR